MPHLSNNLNLIYLQMDSFEETCKKSRQVQQKLKSFLKTNMSTVQETLKKIDKSESILNQNEQQLKNINSLYTEMQAALSDLVDTAAIDVQSGTLLTVAQKQFQPQLITPNILAEVLQKAKNIVIITGKEIIENTGLASYDNDQNASFSRKQQVQVDPDSDNFIAEQQVILTSLFFYNHRKIAWKWITDYYQALQNVSTTINHLLLDDVIESLIKKGKKVSLVTQNIDSLHVDIQESSKKKSKQYIPYPIYELNGSITKVRCDHCSIEKNQIQLEPIDFYAYILKMQSRLYCSSCEGPLRPHIVFYDEHYSQLICSSESVQKSVEEADLIIPLGISLKFGFVSELISKSIQNGKTVVEVSKQCRIQKPKTLWSQGLLSETLQSLKSQLSK